MKKNYNIADAEWEWYIGQLYYQLIKNLYKDDIKCVVELAPGFRHKIADALKETNFTGTIYVIDYSEDVLNYIQEKYKRSEELQRIFGKSIFPGQRLPAGFSGSFHGRLRLLGGLRIFQKAER